MPGKQLRSQFPGFDGLRLVAAVSVLFSHAFVIAEGSDDHEPFRHLLGNILGLYGVFTFFIISGFLLTRSLSLNSSLGQFSANRILRIYPALLFYVLITTFVIGAVITKDELVLYVTKPQTYHFALQSIVCVCDDSPPPFSFLHASFPEVINGSLWSLRFEILSYLFLMCLWLVFRKPLFVALAISLLALLVVWYDYSFLKGIAYTLPYFAGGVAMFVFTARFGTNPWLALLSALLLALSFVAGMQLYAFAVFGAYLVVFLGQHHNPASSFARRVGDWSYGIYLFGWPVEQLANQFFKTNNGFHLFLYSLPVVLAVGAISWVAVERPSLKLKRRVAPLFSRSRLSLKAAKLPETQFAKEYG